MKKVVITITAKFPDTANLEDYEYGLEKHISRLIDDGMMVIADQEPDSMTTEIDYEEDEERQPS